MSRARTLVTLWVLLAVACGGHAVQVTGRGTQAGAGSAVEGEEGGGEILDIGGKGGKGGAAQASGGATTTSTTGGGGGAGTRCATTSNPDHGFTQDTIKVGAILPLTGALRPLGEQAARVIRASIDNINRTDHVPGPLGHLNWGCPSRPGIFGRRVELEIYSLQNSTPEEALAGMRRLIDVEKVFLVRDCYLQDSLMGPATQYQNSKDVPALWCHYGKMPMPQLAHWNFNPGIDPKTQTAIHAGYLFNELGAQRVAVLADPTDEDNVVNVVRRVAKHFGHPIPDDCVIFSRSQEAANGMRSQVARARTCYNPQQTDAVFAGDALQAVFGAMEAKSQGWRPADAGVRWVCTNPSCWVWSLAEICGNACEGMVTDCATLPCVPWADPNEFPAIKNLIDVREQYFPNEPEDAVTYGPAAITGGMALWLTMTGPDLSRAKFRNTLENLRDWSAGIGPIINTSPQDHWGAKAQWLIRYTGQKPWFDDVSGGFVTLRSVGVPEHLTR